MGAVARALIARRATAPLEFVSRHAHFSTSTQCRGKLVNAVITTFTVKAFSVLPILAALEQQPQLVKVRTPPPPAIRA